MLPMFFEIARAERAADGMIVIAFMRADADKEVSVVLMCRPETAKALQDELGSALSAREK